MRTPLSGLTNGPAPLQPLAGFVDPTPQATGEQRSGRSADPRHDQLGEQARPYSWEGVAEGPHGPFGPENQMLGAAYVLLGIPAGYLGQDPTGDYQPVTQAAPWPKGTPMGTDPDTVSAKLIESASIHGSDTNSSRRMLYYPDADPNRTNWRMVDRTDAGDSMQEPLPGQIAGRSGGWGHSDRVQSHAGQNSYGFDSAHVTRRYADGNSIPGNYMWMQPQSRETATFAAHTARPAVGAQSPFTGQDTGAAFGTQGAVLTTLPAEYTSPADPALQAPYPVGYAGVPSSGWVLT